jgi:hypothetical protein
MLSNTIAEATGKCDGFVTCCSYGSLVRLVSVPYAAAVGVQVLLVGADGPNFGTYVPVVAP